MDALLEIKGLKTWFGSRERPLRAVDGVSFSIPAATTVALVGESGCGKSVTALSLSRLVPEPPGFYAGGQILFQGRDVLRMSDRELSNLRGRRISYIFQEPGTALNPVFRVGYQIEEAVKLHRKDVDARNEVVRLMKMVGLPDPEHRARSYPHELSGGMQQRVMIAMALACNPSLLVADEPTTALDVTIQAQILELLRSLQEELRMAVLLITHNLGLVADIAHVVHVMYAGRIVESGRTRDILTKPFHPYTRGLLDSVPRLEDTGETMGEQADKALDSRRTGIPGTVPHPGRLPKGCKFAPRCWKKGPPCVREEPELTENAPDRRVRCYYPLVDET